MTTKDFDAMIREKAGRPTFTVGGQSFTARSKLAWRTFGSLFGGDDADEPDPAEVTERFFRRAIIKADRERFMALLNKGGDDDDDDDDADDAVISPEQLTAVMDWLMEHYTGKRHDSAESSSTGRGSTGARQNVVSLNPQRAAG